jgi:hypothetical protein
VKVHVGQVYIRAGVSFPLSHHFQARLSRELSDLVEPSAEAIERYGPDFELVFDMSAKKGIADNDIRGPSIFKDSPKKVHFTIFLPFDVIARDSEICRCALTYLLMGICEVLGRLGIDVRPVLQRQELEISEICADKTMFG